MIIIYTALRPIKLFHGTHTRCGVMSVSNIMKNLVMDFPEICMIRRVPDKE